MGSTIQRRCPPPALPNSSPSTASPGRALPIAARINASVAWSASVTCVVSGLRLTRRSLARKRDIVERVGGVGELQGEGEVGVDGGTLSGHVRAMTRPTPRGAPSWGHGSARPPTPSRHRRPRVAGPRPRRRRAAAAAAPTGPAPGPRPRRGAGPMPRRPRRRAPRARAPAPPEGPGPRRRRPRPRAHPPPRCPAPPRKLRSPHSCRAATCPSRPTATRSVTAGSRRRR